MKILIQKNKGGKPQMKTFNRWAIFLGLIFCIVPLTHSAVLFDDNFEDNSLSAASHPQELTWSITQGGATIVTSTDGNHRLGVYQGTSTIVSNQQIQGSEYTLLFNAAVTWSERAYAVVMYIDLNNFYAIGIGGRPGIYRMMNGIETKLADDPGAVLRLPHGGGVKGDFKVYVKNDGQEITIKADRYGDGIDYDIIIQDRDPAARRPISQRRRWI